MSLSNKDTAQEDMVSLNLPTCYAVCPLHILGCVLAAGALHYVQSCIRVYFSVFPSSQEMSDLWQQSMLRVIKHGGVIFNE